MDYFFFLFNFYLPGRTKKEETEEKKEKKKKERRRMMKERGKEMKQENETTLSVWRASTSPIVWLNILLLDSHSDSITSQNMRG